MTESTHNDNRPLYNSRVIETYLHFIQSKYPHVSMDELLSYAEMELYEVEDQAHWFSPRQVRRFHEKAVYLTGNEQIAREAGRYAASSDAIGAMRQYILGLVGPANAYKLIGKAASNFSKSSVYESRVIDSNHVEIVVTLNEDVVEQPFQCENRIGFFEAAAMIFNVKTPHIEHPECMFSGGRVCRYVISWQNSFSELWKKIQIYAVLCFLIGLAVIFFLLPDKLTEYLLPLFLTFFFVVMTAGQQAENKELKTSLEVMRNSIEDYIEQLNVNYNNSLLSNEIGQAINKHTRIQEILQNIIQIAENRLRYDRGIILLANRDKTLLKFAAGYGYAKEQMTTLKHTVFNLDKPGSRGTFVESFHQQKPVLINDIKKITGKISSKSLAFAKKMGSQSFLCCPIVTEGESIGVLVVDNVKSKAPLVQSDVSLLMGIACSLGISIRKADLLEARERQLTSIMQVLAASIDARDPLTSGHSEKVTEYVVGICDEMGLSTEYRDMMRVAGLLHDYGKIGVPDSILKKPGKLTDEEYNQIKMHAAKTREILNRVEFDGIYKQVPEIAGSHHEKLDGSGYPLGLKGEEVPIGARILAVADFFEAITARRHYRDPMVMKDAFHLLEQEGRNAHFDEQVVQAFIRFYQKTYPAKVEDMIVE
jgi:HD-GYP domain-containing protein (c-di-GMP phosphodiesterase class II)